MAIALDAVGPSSAGQAGTAASLTWSHTCTGTNLVLIAGVATSALTSAANYTMTYGSQPMTRIGSQATNNTPASGAALLFGLIAPATGAHTVTLTCAEGTRDLTGGSGSFTGVDQVTGWKTFTVAAGDGSQSTFSDTIAGFTAGDWAVAAVCSGTAWLTGSNLVGTELWKNATANSNSGAGNAQEAYNSSSGTVTWQGTGDWWGWAGVELIAASGGGSTVNGTASLTAAAALTAGGTAHGGGAASLAAAGTLSAPAVQRGAASLSAASALTASTVPCVTGLHSTTGASYFTDQFGSPRLLMFDNPWALAAQAGKWTSNDWSGDYDAYLTARAAAGYTGTYLSPYGCGENACTFTDGRTQDGIYPFTSGASNDPSSGLNNTFWTRIDYLMTKAQSLGITVLLNIAYSGGTADMDTGGCLAGKTSTQYQDYGAALAARYAGQQNIIWVVGNDYFGSYDSAYSSILTGLRGGGDTHLIAIHNMPESTSRFDISNNAVMTWGTSNSQFNFGYSYDCPYLVTEYAYAETSPLTAVFGDGYFYQGGGATYFSNTDRAVRQEAWWSLASGVRGWNLGDEAIFPWPSGAQAQTGCWYYTHNSKNIIDSYTALAGWHLLAPAAGSALITGGRGTRATQFPSGGGGGQYEAAFTNSYVAASITPAGSLAVMYLPNAATITVDESKLGGAGTYTASRIDPVSGTATAVTAASTYNSASWGSNSQGDPDWVLVLQASTATSGTAALPAVSSLAAPAVQEAGAALAAVSTLTAAAGGTTPGAAALAASSSLTAGAVQGTGAQLSAASTLAAGAAQKAGAALAAAGALTAPAAQQAGASLTAASSLTAVTAGQGGAALASASTLTTVAVQRAGAVLAASSAFTAGAGSVVQGAASLVSLSSLAGGGAFSGGASLAASASLTVPGKQGAGTALDALSAVFASARQQSGAALAAAAGLTATGAQRGPFTVGILTSGTQSGVNATGTYAPAGAASTSSGVNAASTSP